MIDGQEIHPVPGEKVLAAGKQKASCRTTGLSNA
jgi:hypothetical protein